MSPLQYQKLLRLQEARRLLMTDAVDAATAGHRVGYQSPSRFSLEYDLAFGTSGNLINGERWTHTEVRPTHGAGGTAADTRRFIAERMRARV